MYTWILHDGKDVSWFSEKRVLECEGLQGDNGIFFFINNILFKKRKKKKKKHSWEQLLQVQPAVTKNIVSIFIEVLYGSRVEIFIT